MIVLILFFISFNFVSAGNNTTIINEVPIDYPNHDVVIAEEDGHFNINFSDGYKGYCLEYGEKEATKGDNFYVSVMPNDNVSNYLKTYFVEYYDYAMEDKIVTQHMIWHFTDGFNGWRVNQTLVEMIKETANHNIIPDKGYKLMDNGTYMNYEFKTFLASYEHHQDFFGYKIFFTDTAPESSENNKTNETDNNILSNTTNNATSSLNSNNNKQQNIKENKNITNIKQKNPKQSQLFTHKTGNNLWMIIIALLGLIVVRIKR